jgi:hypothetical protein
MTLAPCSKLGPYEIVGPLGADGMSEVYRANDTRLDRTVYGNRVNQDLGLEWTAFGGWR